MRAIFLDRDGVICQNRSDHVKSWTEFEFLPGAKSGLAALSRLNLPIIVVTNQAVVGRGIVSARVVEEINRKMVEEITASGGRIDRVLYCPHRPEDNCDCRKPKPGMLLQAAAEMGLDLKASYLIGDAMTDIQAGQQVGCHTILVLTGRGSEQLASSSHVSGGHSPLVFYDLLEAADYILKVHLGIIETSEPSDLAGYQQIPGSQFVSRLKNTRL
ncbi:MAG: HAD family hydrolase [Anaerolineales bacterium]|nr:HAD family hydrolase [Anaerolineales bacterium]